MSRYVLGRPRRNGAALFYKASTAALAVVLTQVPLTGAYAATVAVPGPATPVTPSQNQINTLANAGNATCSQQLTNVITQTNIAGLALQTANIPVAIASDGAAAASFAAAGAALTPSVAGAGDNAAGVALGAAGVSFAASVVATGLALGGVIDQASAFAAQQIQNNLPSCDQEFTGTVTVDAGGTNVTGNSIFNNNLSVAGNETVGGTVTVGGPSPGITIGASMITGLGPEGAAPATTGDGNAIAIGNGANATTATSTAVGTNANASSTDTSAFGTNSAATAASASAFGSGATASNTQATAIGAFASATGPNSSAIGEGATASAMNATAIGQGATASALDATASGQGATASGNFSSAYGQLSVASGLQSTASGQGSTASGNFSTAYGELSVASGLQSTATGQGATASGNLSTANGQGATANNLATTASGEGATASGIMSTAYGQGTLASGANSTASGQAAQATAQFASAYGNAAAATAVGSTAVGTNALAPTVGSSALGYNSVVTYQNSVALGSYSGAGAPNIGSPGFIVNPINGQTINTNAAASAAVSVGGGPGSAVPYRQVTNVADGNISATSTDAINGSQLYKAVTGLSQAILTVRREEREGIAGALSLVSAPLPSAGGKTTYAANFGFYKDATALGASFAHRLDVNLPFAVSAGIAVSGQGFVSGRVGVLGEF